MEAREHRLVADEEVVMVGLHMQLCTSQGFARHVETKAVSCEGQGIQAVIPLADINKKNEDVNQ